MPQEKTKTSSLEKEKPPVLYHGSSYGVDDLRPQTKLHREKEGKLVYATSDRRDASMFLEKVSLTGHFTWNGESIAYAIITGGREEFLQRDKGGKIYELPSDSFEPSSHKGMSNEWVSKDSVRPVKTSEYDSALDAMLENDVQVYFVDESQLQQIRTASDLGHGILKRLESENQRRGTHIKSF